MLLKLIITVYHFHFLVCVVVVEWHIFVLVGGGGDFVCQDVLMNV